MFYLLAIAVIAAHASIQGGSADVRDVLRAVLSHVEPDGDDTIVLGRSLDANASAALRALVPRVVPQADGMASSAIPANAIVINSVSVSGWRAVVRLTYGPVPAAIEWTCGQAIAMPLQRTGDEWHVIDADARVRCARQGPRDLPYDRERLVEAARLAFSYIRLAPTVRIVSGPKLSPDALASLKAIAEVLPNTQFETDAMVLPADVFAVQRVELDVDGVHFAGTLGPVPRNATLACGTNWSMKLRQHSNGWSFEDIKITVC